MVYPKTRMKQSRREPRQPLKYHTLLLSSVESQEIDIDIHIELSKKRENFPSTGQVDRNFIYDSDRKVYMKSDEDIMLSKSKGIKKNSEFFVRGFKRNPNGKENYIIRPINKDMVIGTFGRTNKYSELLLPIDIIDKVKIKFFFR